MTGSKLTEEQQLLVAGYVLGHLDAAEMATFAQQMAEQPMIYQEVQRFQASLEASFAPAAVTPPPHLRQALLVKAHQIKTQKQPATVAVATPLPAWIKGLGIAAVVAIAGLSLSNFFFWRTAQRLRLALEAQPTLQIALEPTKTNVSASATVAVDPHRLKANLTVKNLPPLPTGQVYVLWTVLDANAAYTTDDKNAILTEVFTVDTQAEFSKQIFLPRAFRDVNLVEAVAISIEDADAPQRHESSPILIKQL